MDTEPAANNASSFNQTMRSYVKASELLFRMTSASESIFDFDDCWTSYHAFLCKIAQFMYLFNFFHNILESMLSNVSSTYHRIIPFTMVWVQI